MRHPKQATGSRLATARRFDRLLAVFESTVLAALVLVLAAGGIASILDQNASESGARVLLQTALWGGAATLVCGALIWNKRGFDLGARIVILGVFLLCVAASLSLRDVLDYLLRASVLWIGLIGACLATRERQHIAIEVLPRMLGRRGKRFAALAIHATAIAILIVLFAVSLEYVSESRERGEVFFTRRASGFALSEWIVKSILPISMAIMIWRFSLLFVEALLGEDPPPEVDRPPGVPNVPDFPDAHSSEGAQQ